MVAVILALYAEGSTDGDFLPQIIRRTTENILLEHNRALSEIDILLPYSEYKKPADITKRDECILRIARETAGYHALIIHSDSDDRGYEQTITELFQPGKNLAQAEAKDKPESVCIHLVPLIPIRMTEAWMLADPNALRTVLNTKIDVSTLGIPPKAKLVEKEHTPKTKLDLIIKTAYPGQDRVWKRFREKLYKELGSQISLERLKEVPSYQRFVKDLTDTLEQLNFIPHIYLF